MSKYEDFSSDFSEELCNLFHFILTLAYYSNAPLEIIDYFLDKGIMFYPTDLVPIGIIGKAMIESKQENIPSPTSQFN